jgi:HD-like signal output (HDOD) protein
METTEALGKLTAEAENNELVFSTHAHVALQVRMALDVPDIHMDKAAKVVHADPILAAKVVGLANSVAFNRSGSSVSDVRSAVMRLGVNLIRGMSTALIIRQFSATTTTAQQALSARLWEHSAHVAALSYVLARRIGKQNADTAMFAGIVHEIGGFYLISRASVYPALIDQGIDDAWQAGGEAQVGGAVMRALAVPDDIATAVKSLWQGEVNLPPGNLADILFLANCLAPILNPLQSATSEIKRIEALALATQYMADQGMAALLEESAEELNSITASLTL